MLEKLVYTCTRVVLWRQNMFIKEGIPYMHVMSLGIDFFATYHISLVVHQCCAYVFKRLVGTNIRQIVHLWEPISLFLILIFFYLTMHLFVYLTIHKLPINEPIGLFFILIKKCFNNVLNYPIHKWPINEPIGLFLILLFF